MEFDPLNQFSDNNFNKTISIREIVENYLTHLKWFILSIIIFGALTYLKIRFEVPKYNITASILIKDKDGGSSFSDMSSIEDFGLFGMGNNSLLNEIQILNSRNLMTKVVEELNLKTRYFIESSPYNNEIYPNSPIIINIKSDSLTINNLSTKFEIIVKSKDKFEFVKFDDASLGENFFGKNFTADMGNLEVADKRIINIELNSNYKGELIGETIIVSINPLNNVVNNYMERLIINLVDDRMSDVLTLSIDTTVKEKGKAVINNLIQQYNADGINDNNQIAQATTDFLDERLSLISAELTAIESTAAQFKTSRGMIDANAEANYFLQSSTIIESELVAANTQMQVVNYMFDVLSKSNFGDLLPGNIGLSEPSILNLISEYNNLVLQRNRILKSSSTKNPIIINIDSQLDVLKNNLVNNLNTLKTSLQIQIKAISNKSGRIGSKIASVPRHEKDYKEIVRKQETKNALYLFLLQKREESILSNAVKIDKAKVIDYAYSSDDPISPKKKLLYFASIILGLIVPVSIIYIKDLLDTKIHDEKDLAKLNIPYLGDVPLATTKKDIYLSGNDNSNIAEAFRYLRTNINFMLDIKDNGKIIFVTSTQSHEGKTFTAINLASSISVSGKKTLLLGMDLRAPKISNYLEIESELGVSNYIKNKALTLDDITVAHTIFSNLDTINSGDIPPNPVELLMGKRVKNMFDELKNKYEYIIVDTAPVGMVTDTIQIGIYSDLTIYVVRANFLDKRMLHIPLKLHKDNKLPNMAILINGSDNSKGAYGYGYGYGQKRKKPWYKKIYKNTWI